MAQAQVVNDEVPSVRLKDLPRLKTHSRQAQGEGIPGALRLHRRIVLHMFQLRCALYSMTIGLRLFWGPFFVKGAAARQLADLPVASDKQSQHRYI